MDPDAVLELCHEHAAAEAELDVDRVLATLVTSPRYEFFPSAVAVTGWGNVERFYRHEYPRFVGLVAGFELLDEWAGVDSAVQEYVITLRGGGGHLEGYRVLSKMRVDAETGLLAGETLYCAEGFARALLGAVWEVAEPVAG